MNRAEFIASRNLLRKTQKEMAHLLGISLKAVHSYEQGWRNIPGHVERQVFFLLAKRPGPQNGEVVCWEIKDCPLEVRSGCPAWEFDLGSLCWFACGTICQGEAKPGWEEKMRICKSCQVFQASIVKSS